MEYCISFWTPHLKRNRDKLECVQRGLDRLARGLETLSYSNDGRTWECLVWEIKDLGNKIAIFKDLS